MKSVIKNQEKSKITYPHLGVTSWADGKDIVVLFNTEGHGMVVYSNYPNWKVGEYSMSWAMEAFNPFNGTIELSNN